MAPPKPIPGRLTVDDAVRFLEAIQDQSKAEPQVYKEFLDIMRRYKHNEIDIDATFKSVERTFNNYAELFERFKEFKSSDSAHNIEGINSRVDSKSAVNLDSDLHDQDAADIVAHLKKLSLKDEVAAQPEKQTVLHETIQAYEDKRIDTQDVVQRATELFEGHDELIMQFNSLLIVS